jgi:hypothetical protein
MKFLLDMQAFHATGWRRWLVIAVVLVSAAQLSGVSEWAGRWLGRNATIDE